jgi:predicted dehydrogenase
VSAVAEKAVAIVGAGRAGRSYAEALVDLPEVRLVALVDPDRSAARRLAGPATAVFAEVGSMLRARVVPDIALICCPPSTRADAAEPLLLAGVDLLVEAPVATTPGDADRLAVLAERAGRTASSAARLRFHPGLRPAREALASGAIGALQGVELCLAAKRSARQGWRGDPALAGGGVVMDLGAEALELVERLAGPIARIRLRADERVQRAEVEDWALLETEHAGGVGAALELSWNELPARPLARCLGERGEIALGWARSFLRRADGSEQTLAGAWDERDAARALIEELLRERRGPPQSCERGPHILGWLHAAYRSRDGRRWQTS